MRARVQNGKWVIEDPTDGLPEGTVVEILTRPAKGDPSSFHFDDTLIEYVELLLKGTGATFTQEDGVEIVRKAKTIALAAGRDYATPADVKTAAPEVLRRFVFTEDRVRSILGNTPVP